jgi:hypothetical protein
MVSSNSPGRAWCRISRSIWSIPSLRALVEGLQRLIVAVVADPDLRLEEDLGAVEIGAANGLAHLSLVEVRRGGVDVAVAGGQRRLDGCDRLVRR